MPVLDPIKIEVYTGKRFFLGVGGSDHDMQGSILADAFWDLHFSHVLGG
jgi:hypothetical protein